MSGYQRPWWLIVHTSARLVTTIRDESVPGQRTFVVKGEPTVQGVTWLTCGPAAALAIIAVLVVIAVAWNVQSQSAVIRALFVGAFLGLPPLFWGLTVVIANSLSARHLAAIRQAESQVCTITLNQGNGTLAYENSRQKRETVIPYHQIQRVHVTPAIGAVDGTQVYLTLETDEGALVLLNEEVGNHNQKADLALTIEKTIKKYLSKQESPST